MKYFIITLSLIAILFTSMVHASGQVPYEHQISTIPNYNRITPYVAISGLIGDGGAPLLAAYDFKTVIDVRTVNEGTDAEMKLIEAVDIVYINVPITVKGISEEQLADFTKAYEAAEKPILIHCGSGNRAGAMWASYQISKGFDPEEAIKQGRKAGMRPALEEKIRASMLN